MKNIIKSGVLALMTVFAMTACDPQESDDHSLGAPDTVSSDQVSFTYTSTSKSENEIVFTNTSTVNVPYSVAWSLGNGAEGKTRTITAQYPEKGQYTVTLTVYTADGTAASKSQVLSIDKDDFGLIDTPTYRMLTGGMEKPEGKIWVIDQYNNYAKEVANATGKDVKGHMGLGPNGSYGQGWWGAGPSEKGAWELYKFKFNFRQQGAKLIITNNGKGYGRAASAASVGKFNVTEVDGEDAVFDYSGGEAGFSIAEDASNEDAYPVLTLGGNAFMGYYCGSQDYEIFYQTDEVMALRINNSIENSDWVLVYCLEELNVSTPPVVKEPKAIPLFEDFEEAESAVTFEYEEMGDRTAISDNPNFNGNESEKVFRFQKSISPSSNVFFVASDYKFDLTEQNKITMKILMPSSNDYATDYGKEDWAPSAKLLPRLVVKLYDSSHGSPWETGTNVEVTFTEDQLDKWIEYTFDFSSVAARKDYDKIVVQFGQEGHYGPGVFYFDDFKFHK